jgi:hypothetical protein
MEIAQNYPALAGLYRRFLFGKPFEIAGGQGLEIECH